MNRKGKILLAATSLILASTLFGGFSSGQYKLSGSSVVGVGLAWQTGGTIITEDGQQSYSPEARLLRGAAKLLTDAMNSPGCGGVTGLPGGSGTNPPPSVADFLAKLKSMLDNNQFCSEDPTLDEHHNRFGHEAASFTKAGGIGLDGAFLKYGQPAMPVSLPGVGPGTNIVWAKFKPQLADPDSLASQATLAAILAHEVYHVTKNHNDFSSANETDAYFSESEMICCMVSSLVGQGPAEDAAIDALCNRADSIAKRYKAEGGQGSLPNCCVNPPNPCPPKTPPLPPLDPAPRSDMGDDDLLGSSAGYSDNTGSWSALLDATMDFLYIHRSHPLATGEWEYSLDSVISSSFDAQFLVGGNKRQLYIGGRNEVNGNGELYRLDLGWSQGAPALSVTTIYSGAGFGDVISMGFTGSQNNSIAIFDWTNAQLVGVDVMTGQVTVLAGPGVVPELEEMASMMVMDLYDLNGNVTGLVYSFQDHSDYDHSFFESTRKRLTMFDEGADGSFEEIVVSTP